MQKYATSRTRPLLSNRNSQTVKPGPLLLKAFQESPYVPNGTGSELFTLNWNGEFLRPIDVPFGGLFRESRGERCIIVSYPKSVDFIWFLFHNITLLGFNCALAIVIYGIQGYCQIRNSRIVITLVSTQYMLYR